MTPERSDVRCVRVGRRVPKRQKDRFTRNLKEFRERRRFTQADAAEFVSFPSVRTVQNREIGRTLPVGVALAILCAAIQSSAALRLLREEATLQPDLRPCRRRPEKCF